uniref:Biopolymer transport protein (ExbD) n=1 Tax=uncultured marine thaumarchaeote AD1000_06_A03 TaxID=1455884 RepID=A0A075FH50_9ARCH|nr:biopolymer transport protein (exbD) [uncultured marine thaumarchaeote AD1000_06_A03]
MPKIQSTENLEVSTRRHRRGVKIGTALSEINVVPLVDVMLVLLIIFMVTAPMIQQGLDVSLPRARRVEPIVAERIFVTVPLSYRTDGIVQVGEDPVPFELLPERIETELNTRTERNVFLRGDGNITYQELMSIIDALKIGGVEEVGLVTDLP